MREHDRNRIFLDLRLQTHLDDVRRIDPARAAWHHILLINRGELVADDLLDFIFARQDILELGNLAFELLDVLGAVEDVLLVDVAEFDFGNKLRLGLVDIKAAHQVGHDLGLELGSTDDGDGLVDIEQDRLEAVQKM